MQITFGSDELSQLATELKNHLVPILIEELRAQDLPPLLTRKQFMELTDIGPTKCNELFNRADFPVNRELGHPKVPTKQFFEWVSKTTNRTEISFNRAI
ncbi:hypothetical protein JNUCC1_03316 [Lentibacillus sp. JNUCC-1]|uniref:hypothetical protein n=1 Tax=Lentibacillus sp. JNUCC-1 TaxID=2654513 RepID=UPI0012E86CB4|nr:hypothetical protein [Lentibacillus sp. JNUCC-1]MUV39438.1 hypothetical protein [Lentibacillus sp. JNUCC-1]